MLFWTQYITGTNDDSSVLICVCLYTVLYAVTSCTLVQQRPITISSVAVSTIHIHSA